MKRILVVLLVVLSVFLLMSCEDDPKGGKTVAYDVDAYIVDYVYESSLPPENSSYFRYVYKLAYLHDPKTDNWVMGTLSSQSYSLYQEVAYADVYGSEGSDEVVGKYLTWPLYEMLPMTMEEFHEDSESRLYLLTDGSYIRLNEYDSIPDGATLVEEDNVILDSSEGYVLFIDGNFYFPLDSWTYTAPTEKMTGRITSNNATLYLQSGGNWYDETPQFKFTCGEDVYYYDFDPEDM